MSFRYRLVVVLLCLFAAAPFAAMAQTAPAAAGANVHGLVTDPDDALVPGATVTFTLTGSKTVQTATSKSDGTYSLRVPPGTYIVAVTAPGFAAFVKEGVKVTAAS